MDGVVLCPPPRSRGSLCHSARGVMHTKDNRSPKSGKRPTPLDSTVVAASMLRNFLLLPSRPFFPLRPREKLKKGGRLVGEPPDPDQRGGEGSFPLFAAAKRRRGRKVQFHYSLFPSPLSIPAAEFPTPFSASLRRRRQSVHFTRISPLFPCSFLQNSLTWKTETEEAASAAE